MWPCVRLCVCVWGAVYLCVYAFVWLYIQICVRGVGGLSVYDYVDPLLQMYRKSRVVKCLALRL